MLILCCQLLIVLASPLAQSWAESTGTDRLRQKIVRMMASYRAPIRIVLGATSHPVFMDSHFRGYNHMIGLAYREHSGELHWLPLIEENGDFGSYNTGRYFVKWTWRVCAPTMRKESLEKGIRDFTAFWCRQNHINLINVHFTVFAKRIESPPLFTAQEGSPSGWEEGFYRRQRDQPWQTIGNAHWAADGGFEVQISEIEKL